MNESTVDRARAWVARDPDPETRAELASLIERAATDGTAADELDERMSGRLEFGTAGIRGVLAAGPQRMNQLQVREVTAGVAAYLVAEVPDACARGVVVGHDARHKSRLFAEETAAVLAAAGFTVWLAEAEWPTPVTAYAVRAQRAAAGVMVTASHNPPEYNGYKVYWGNGAQIIPPIDGGIAAAIERAAAAPIPVAELAAARAAGQVRAIGAAMESAYVEAVLALQVAPEVSRAALAIAYTPLHGVGAALVERVLAAAGFDRVATEPSQRAPDGAFPTVAFPNPEEKGAMDRVLALAARERAALVLANDPDADRLAVAIPDASTATGYRMLTGDQVGVLLADYLLAHAGAGPRLVACSLVSSQMLRFLAATYGADSKETLTGFKWIANEALAWQARTGGRFVMGYEEALGYCVGELVGDKDGVSAALLFAELAAWNRARGRTIAEHLDDLYRRVGLFVTEQVSITLPGADGIAAIKRGMAAVRGAPPTALGDVAVEQVRDLALGADGLPPSDVLVFALAEGRRVIMRPSGTEPKLKSYYEVRVAVGADEPLADARARGLADLGRLRDAHQALLRQAMGS
ncbi:MAG: phospho-sugar mutase [Myxococcales bacterium]|nr:phospho-sugar mutase [Myxococcales bacterium]